MRKNRKRIIITALEILAVLLLLAPAYRLACGIGLKKNYSPNGITIYADGVEHKEEAKQMAETLRTQLLEVDSEYSPKISFYFCRTMTGFRTKAIAIGKPLALSRTGLKATLIRPCDWTKNSIEPRKPEYFYFVSRLRTDYLLNFKKVSESDYWSTKYDEDQLDDEIRQALREKRYAFTVL